MLYYGSKSVIRLAPPAFRNRLRQHFGMRVADAPDSGLLLPADLSGWHWLRGTFDRRVSIRLPRNPLARFFAGGQQAIDPNQVNMEALLYLADIAGQAFFHNGNPRAIHLIDIINYLEENQLAPNFLTRQARDQFAF